MARHTLAAQPRMVHGKDTRKLRREGIVPGVVYGPVVPEPISVSVDAKELNRMYYAFGPNLLIDLKLNGTTHTVYMRHVQMDRLKKAPLHAEFFAPNMRAEITTSVPVLLTGEPGDTSGIVTPGFETIELRGLPDALPANIEVDLSTLTEIDQAIYVRDLTIPPGVTLLTDPDAVVVKLNAPTLRAAAEEAEEAQVDLDEAAEAGGVEGAADADASDESES